MRCACAHALGQIQDTASRDTLIKWLDDLDTPAEVRSQCASALGNVDDEASRRALGHCLDDPATNDRVWAYCARAISGSADASFAEDVVKRLNQESTRHGIVEECFSVFGIPFDKVARDLLIRWLESPTTDEENRSKCLLALGKTHDPCPWVHPFHTSRDLLINRLNDPEEPLRRICARALSDHIHDDVSKDAIVACFNDFCNRCTSIFFYGPCNVRKTPFILKP